MKSTDHKTKKSWIVYQLAILLLIFLPSQNLSAQDDSNFKEFKGEIVSAKGGKTLEYASVSITNSNISTVSNTEGEFSIKVPEDKLNESVRVSYLGYKTAVIPLSSFGDKPYRVRLEEYAEKLPDVDIVQMNADGIVRRAMENRRANSYPEPTIVQAFYRESIKKRRTYASLSEAVVDIYKPTYGSAVSDNAKLIKARKSTDYKKIDTLVIKLQGGPYNNLGMDLVRNKDIFFTTDIFEIYDFSYDKMIELNNKNVYVISFEQRPGIVEPFYKGKLYIDAGSYALVRAVFSLNLTNLNKAKKFFVRKKPPNADVIPLETEYIVDFREIDGKWHFNYSRIQLDFKVKWDKKLFNSIYHIAIEMAITDWKVNTEKETLRNRDRMRKSVILNDQASGFSDPDFWGERNVIEPDKSIDNAIKKIQRLNKS